MRYAFSLACSYPAGSDTVADFSVHDEPDFERVYDEDETVPIRKGDLRAILDVATQSMDFGSGFLNNEEVEALRKGAEILGIDPIVVTPSNFVCVYQGHSWIVADYGKTRYCPKCGTKQALRDRHDLPRGSEFVDVCGTRSAWIPDEGQRDSIVIPCPACGTVLTGWVNDPGRYKGMVHETGDTRTREPRLSIELPLHVPPMQGPV